MELKSRLNYNNNNLHGYGKGNAYVAKIVGEDPKYKLKREFLKKEILYNNSSKTIWYTYKWNIEDNGIYEFKEENAFKHEVEYFKYNAELNVKEPLTYAKVLKMFVTDIKDTDEYKEAFEKAKMTGEKQLVSSRMEPCNNPAEECNWDFVDRYVLPSGEINIVRRHTY